MRDLPGGPGAPFPYCDLVRPIFTALMSEQRAEDDPVEFAWAGSSACGRQARAGADDYALFDCI
jgi:hypothetical protein